LDEKLSINEPAKKPRIAPVTLLPKKKKPINAPINLNKLYYFK
jgi:hypothetical protein